MNRSAGFTLVEILVALMILGVAAGTMSSVMSTAFKSYESLSNSSQSLQIQNRLSQVMNEISGYYWLPDGVQKEKVLSAFDIAAPHYSNLGVESDDNNRWALFATLSTGDKVQILDSATELRFFAIGAAEKTTSVGAKTYNYHTLNLEQLDGNWQVLASTPLKVDASPSCLFDIVRRQCQ